jgi:hypothetical protein
MSERRELVVAGMRVAGPVTAIAVFIAWYLSEKGKVAGLEVLGVILLGPLIGFPIGVLVGLGSRAAGEHIIRTLTSSGGLPPAPDFSYQDAQVIRGNPEVARASYEAHLKAEPKDLNARLALARLWRDQLGDARKAEQLYLEARQLEPSPEQEFAIGNALIDLYRGSQQRGREMAELARFAERFAGTQAGMQARAALLRLKERGT